MVQRWAVRRIRLLILKRRHDRWPERGAATRRLRRKSARSLTHDVDVDDDDVDIMMLPHHHCHNLQ
jgi:hypothetical protein